MIISIITGGSRGDVQPYIALGKGLKEVGYEVQLIASTDFEDLVKDAGLTFCSMGISVESILQSDEWRETTERGNFLAIISKMRKEMKHYARQSAETMPDLLQGTDWIITGIAGFGGGFSIAEKMNIPVIQAYVFPITPTRDYASPLMPKLPFGDILNPLSFRLLRQMLWQSTRSSDVETRQLLGMPKASVFGPFQNLDKMDTPTLYGYSQYVVPQPTDWSDNQRVTGYWFLDQAKDWTPPSHVADFLNDRDAPIYIGFGSMLNKNPEAVLETILEALKLTGQRGILASGWGGMSQRDLPDDVLMISSIPHGWLFPRMKAVVHHGGAGTTAAGLRAGVPSIIVPFMGDQSFWGHRVASLGVGPEPIPRKRLSATRLAQAIDQAVADTTMRQKAQLVSQQIKKENGIKQAVDIIRDVIGQAQSEPALLH